MEEKRDMSHRKLKSASKLSVWSQEEEKEKFEKMRKEQLDLMKKSNVKVNYEELEIEFLI